MTNWHTKTSTEIFEILKINERGLNKEEVNLRLKEYGLNKLPEAKVDNPAIIFLRQFQSPLIYILFAASLAIFYLKEFVDSLIILGVLFFNAVVGALQEGKAQNTLLALKNFIETNAEVLRDGKEIIIPDSKLVPGDIILLQEGEKIPADARIIVSNNLKIDQASLTGESIPIYKTSEKIHREDLAIIDQKNMVFKGTYIAAGNGQAVVVATGLDTAIGKISQEITLIDAEIPLKKDIRQLSRMIIIIVAVIGAILFFSGIFSGKSLIEMFKVVVAISVSIIPEGLPIVITLVLATGVWRMAKQNALVKKLQAVEALGQAKIIAIDKTGTITKNELAVQEVFINGKVFEIRGVGYEPKGEIYFENQLISSPDFEDLIFSGKIASFCANARVFYSEENKNYKVSGDPTEAALLVFSQKVGFQKEIIDAQHPLIKEIPFDYKNRYHATIRKVDDKNFLTVVGAPESVIPLCKFTKKLRRPDIASGVGAPTEASGENEELEPVLKKMLEQGLRVLAFAYNRRVSEEVNFEKMSKLSFGGFFGIKDSLRPEAKEAIRRAKDAGIGVIMITGDNKITAMALAKEAGIYTEGDGILTDKDLDALSEEELVKKLPEISVFARVTPEHKLKIIEAYKKRKEIIAMTGDGVNDAPSLVAADLGIGMGNIGTEVAKEASDIVLLDDNFETIVSAIEEGRSIYKTIKKVILYLFSTSLGEVLAISIALFSGYPLPLLAGQIIWLNFITDGFLDVALAMEPKEKGLLRKNWKRKGKYMVDLLMVQRMFVMALPMSIGAFFVFQKYLPAGVLTQAGLDFNSVKAMTMSLTVLAIFQWLNVWNCRSEDKSVFRMNIFSNKWLVGATFIVVSLQFLAVYNPIMQKILHTVSLDISDWLFALSVASSIIVIEEIRKLIYNKLRFNV